jgi:hypothetical protein
LGLQTKTAAKYVSTIFGTLPVAGRVEAMVRAREAGGEESALVPGPALLPLVAVRHMRTAWTGCDAERDMSVPDGMHLRRRSSPFTVK